MDFVVIISLFVGTVSIVLAIITIILSKGSEKDSRANFNETQKLLSDIRSESAVIKEATQKNLEQLTSLFRNLLDKVLGPTPTITEQQHDKELERQIIAQLVPELLKNPEKLSKLVEVSKELKQSPK